jgi:hypothetical protein
MVPSLCGSIEAFRIGLPYLLLFHQLLKTISTREEQFLLVLAMTVV